jgi:hypothetical protein
MDTTALLTEFIHQSPTLAACLFLVIVSARYMARQHAKHLSDLRSVHRDTMKLVKQSNDNLVAALRAQLRQLEKGKRDADELAARLTGVIEKLKEPGS